MFVDHGREALMGYPVDTLKLERVHRMLEENSLDAVVVRAPDNVLYLTNYWPMKGYDLAIFPREGEPALLVIQPQLAEARRTAWTKDVRAFRFYHPSDPRPPTERALDLGLEVLRERGFTGRVGIELSQNSQICDRMVGEPTVYTQRYFDAFRDVAREVVDATPLLAGLRAIKTPQEIERMRLANELAAIGMEYARDHIRPGMRESEVAAMIEGHIHAVGIGYQGKVDMARAFTLVRPGHRHLHGHLESPGHRKRAHAGRNLGLRRWLLDRPHKKHRPRQTHAAVQHAGRTTAGDLQ